MNPVIDAHTVQQAISILSVLFSLAVVLGIIVAVLQIAQFFRRAPPIDQTLAALVKEFQAELAQRVHVRDFDKAETRHQADQAAMELRTDRMISDMEIRFDKRFEGLHGSIVELRKTNEKLLLNLQEIVKDMKLSREK